MPTFNQISFPVEAMQYDGTNQQAIIDAFPDVALREYVEEGTSKAEIYLFGVDPIPTTNWVVRDWHNLTFQRTAAQFAAEYEATGGGET